MGSTRRLPVARVAVASPPARWFHGISRTLYDTYWRALRDLGLETIEVPVDAFVPPDMGRISELLADVRAFRPQLAIGLPLGNLALSCRLPAGRDGWRPNFFADVLGLPTVCQWDHAPFDLADQLLTPHAASPEASLPGALPRLRRALAHPRLIHWSRDDGQTAIMTELGLLPPGRPIFELPPALPDFELHGRMAATEGDVLESVAFIGHFYQEPATRPACPSTALARRAIADWQADGGSLWNSLSGAIAALAPSERAGLALEHDQSFFWGFVHRLVVHDAQTARRFTLLGAAGVPVTCYGNLQTGAPGVPPSLGAVPGHIPFGRPLAHVMTRHAILVDVMNPGFIDGISHKPMAAFAAGGFMLLDRKRHFVEAFGEAGAAVSYDGPDELAAKIDFFLGRPERRRELGDEIRARLLQRHRLSDVLARVLGAAADSIRSTVEAPPTPIRAPTRPIKVKNLLPSLRSHAAWTGAAVRRGLVGRKVSTGPGRWGYAAAIELPEIVGRLEAPYLQVTLHVEEGRIGIGTIASADAPFEGEQLFGKTARPITATLELPRAGTVVLRNAAGAPSRARILTAYLCDRHGG